MQNFQRLDYKIELHLHTAEFGWCASVGASKAVEIYSQIGYSGFCTTDHFFFEGMESMAGETWDEKVRSYLKGYYIAKDYAAKFYPDFKVFLGAELRTKGGFDDFLLYGVSEEFLFAAYDIFDMKRPEVFEFCNSWNVLVIQAHPYRYGLEPVGAQYVHGIEIFNGNIRHDSRNNLAVSFAAANDLIGISGSDFHQFGDEDRGGIFVEKIPAGSIELADILKSLKFSVI